MEILPKETHVLNGIISAQHRFLDHIHPNHGHDFFEIEYFISGEGTYVIDGTEYPIMENSLFFMSPANTHALLSDKGELINVMFSYDICDTPLLAQWFSTPNARVGTFSDEENIFIRGLLDEMVRACKKGNTDYAVELLRCVLYKITENIMENKNRTSTHIQKAIGFIIGNFRSKITLKDTADHVKLVPSYLSSLFAEETGKIKTVVQIIAVLTVLFFGNNGPLKPLFGFSLGWWSMLIASLFTIYSGYVYLAKNWKLVVNSK